MLFRLTRKGTFGYHQMRFARIAVFVALSFGSLFALANAAHALDFKKVGTEPVILYDASSKKAVASLSPSRGMPVEVVLTYGE